MILTVKQLLDEYRQQLKINTSSADQSLLTDARKILNEALDRQFQENVLDKEAVHLANEVSYFFGGDKNLTVKVLTQYLTQSLTVEEESWARWQLVDNLAMLRKCEEVVEKHQSFLAWARKNLTQDQLLWVMYDSTQSFCWMAVSKSEEWIQVFNEMMMTVTPSAENRYDRFIYLRTANRMYGELMQFEEALQIVRRIRDLCDEESNWKRGFGIRIEADISEILMQWKLQNVSAVRKIGENAIVMLRDHQAQLGDLDFDQKRDLSGLYNNLGASFYFIRQYDLAIPLCREAIKLDVWEHWVYSRLAASLWATSKSRSDVLPLLKQASERVVGSYNFWKELPEFQDVINDAEFLNLR